MSWLVPFYIGILYFCFGLAILNAGVFNNGLGYMATATVTVSTLVHQPVPTGSMAGYLPYKSSVSPWLDNRPVWIREETRVKDEIRYASADDLPGCQSGMRSCHDLGHPEICCNENHTCLPTNNTSAGVYCCRSPDPVALPCDDTNLQCEPDWYQCSATLNGGCCKYGQTCGLLECYDDDGLATSIAQTTSITGSEDDTIIERTTLRYTNSTVTITSTSTSMGATATTPLITGSPTEMTSDPVFTGTFGTGGPITHLDPNRPGATSTDSAGSRAKVGRHWSWAVMTWWIIAIIAEGV